jgi:hypothetical protein
MLVRSVVVEDEVNVKIGVDGLIDPFKKPNKLLMPVPAGIR